MDDLPSRLRKPKVYEEIETPIAVLEGLRYEKDKDFYKDLDKAKNHVAQNN
ncbi:hypothetical protein [Priestia megaterium]|uniref:hypothetical protein n=1 Tax=Priestia megaterium TaxID=1404 RepID=UPI00149460D8|nr:hypothetical protein [Priestia megaterium]